MMKITLKQKRFLIVWTLCNTFALCTDLLNWRGYVSREVALFNAVNVDTKFWPFNPFIQTVRLPSNNYQPETWFNGIFIGYGLTEYIVYMAIGLGFIYLPKLWNDNAISNNQPQQ